MSQTTIMLHGQIKPVFLYTSAKAQPTAVYTSHLIVMYVPTTNTPLKCHIYAAYANYLMCRYKTTMLVDMHI